MNGEVFRSARDYHGAIADYCRALSLGEDVEDAAQRVVGASLYYRDALARLIGPARPDSLEGRVGQRRLAALRSLLHYTSRHYNLRAKARHLRP